MNKSEALVRQLFASAGVEVNGSSDTDIQVYDDDFYEDLLRGGSKAFGRMYVDGRWDAKDTLGLLRLIIRSRLDEVAKSMWPIVWRTALTRTMASRFGLVNLQSIARSLRVARQHYDLPAGFYRRMLGEVMVYSCPLFAHKDEALGLAQIRKADTAGELLELQPNQAVYDQGCGFGFTLDRFSQKYGTRGLGVTISKEQFEYASRQSHDNHSNEFRLLDYRKFCPGQIFDRAITVGAAEHWGRENYATAFAHFDSVLKSGGLLFFHAISTPDRKAGTDPWIEEEIFPGGELVHMEELFSAAASYFETRYVEEIPPWHYARGLRLWRENLAPHWEEINDEFGFEPKFERKWNYYLYSCEAAFLENAIRLHRAVFSKRGARTSYSYLRWK